MRLFEWALIQSWLVSLYEEEIKTQLIHRLRDDHVGTQQECSQAIYKPRGEASEETECANNLILGLQPPKLWESKYLLFEAPSP